jgi:hypothetical protein
VRIQLIDSSSRGARYIPFFFFLFPLRLLGQLRVGRRVRHAVWSDVCRLRDAETVPEGVGEILGQGVYTDACFLLLLPLYSGTPRTAHRLLQWFEEHIESDDDSAKEGAQGETSVASPVSIFSERLYMHWLVGGQRADSIDEGVILGFMTSLWTQFTVGRKRVSA